MPPNVLISPPGAGEPIRCLKAAGPRSVWLVRTAEGLLCTLKSWPLNFSLRWRRLLGLAQHQRQIRGTRRLQTRQIPTPEIHSLRTNSAAGTLELLLEYTPGQTLVDLELAGPEVWPLARELGRLVARIAQQGLVHRDLKLSNIILSDEADGPTFWVIDTVDVKPGVLLEWSLCRMLDRLSCLALARYMRQPVDPLWVVAVLKHALRPFPPARRRRTLRWLRFLKRRQQSR